MRQKTRRSTRRRQTRKRGGKLVGVGKYGCGFIPALRCEEDSRINAKNFSKLMLKTEANAEWMLRETIAEIDPEMQYSVYATKKCSVKPVNLQLYHKNVEKCTPLLHLATTTDKPIWKQIQEKKEHIALLKAPAKRELFDYVHKTRNKFPFLWPAFFRSFENLLNGLAVYHSHSFYHTDIKLDNIVLEFLEPVEQITPSIAKYIDFGLAIYSPDKEIQRDSLQKYRKLSEMYPLYFFFASFSPEERAAMPIEPSLTHFVNAHYKMVNQYTVPFDAYYTSEGTPKLTPEILQQQLLYMNTLDLHRILEKVDLYCLGKAIYACIIHVCNILPKNSGNVQVLASPTSHTDAFEKGFLTGLYGLLQRMVSPFLEETLTAQEAATLYKELLDSLST